MSKIDRRLTDWERKIKHNLLPKDKQSVVVRALQKTNSTMAAARVLAENLSSEEYGVVIAQEQTNGRGRQGRTWSESDQALYYTLIFDLGKKIDLTGFSLVVGLATVDVLSSYNAEVYLKWPNDVVDKDKRKLSGVLIEKDNNNLVVGIGVNLLSTPQEVPMAVSVYDLINSEVHPSEFAGKLTSSLIRYWEEYKKYGFSYFRQDWLNTAYRYSEDIEISTVKGVIKGKFYDISDVGELIIDTGVNKESVMSGHIGTVEK